MFEKITDDINIFLKERLTPAQEYWLNRDIIIPIGKYKGRKGKVTYIGYDSYHGVMVMFRPYRQVRRGMETITTTDLLWDHIDTRRCWSATGFIELKDWVD